MNGKKKRDEGIEENLRFFRKKRERKIGSLFGLHASFTLSDETLRLVKEASGEDIGYHIHLAEGKEDLEDSLKRYGKRAAERLLDWSILREGTIVAHGIHLDDGEMAILKDSRVFLAHNPSSNMNNAVGYAMVRRMSGLGVKVGIGTDGFGQDILMELRQAFLLMKHSEGNPNLGGEVVGWLKNNWEFAERHFNEKLGRIEKGALADLVVFDYVPPTPLNSGNYLSHLLFGLLISPVYLVMVEGKVIYEGGKFTRMDEEEILFKTRKRAKRLWDRIHG
jgi:cytosine/adenosine deaminase-related metal-dependent hydrolase